LANFAYRGISSSMAELIVQALKPIQVSEDYYIRISLPSANH
jgi:hypothetical protein